MQENQTLRGLLRSLSSFIGDGAGGLLPKLGWDMADFNNFVSRSETDTAWESYQRRKKSSPSASGSQATQGQKRPAEEDGDLAHSKKARGIDNHDQDRERTQDGYSLLVPMNTSLPANNLYPPSSRPSQDGSLFSDLMRSSTGSPMFMQPSPSTNSSTQYGGPSPSNVNNYQSSYMPSMNVNVDAPLPPLPFSAGSNTQGPVQQRITQANQLSTEQVDDDDDPNKHEAYKLISYAFSLISEPASCPKRAIIPQLPS